MLLYQLEGVLQVCKCACRCAMLAAINAGGDVVYGLLYTIHGGLGMNVVVLLFLYMCLEGL